MTQEMTEKVKILMVAHGPHTKGGNNAATYDGPLKPEAIETLKRLTLPDGVDVIYVGEMRRQVETMEAIKAANPHLPEGFPEAACGNDRMMFASLEGDHEAFQSFRELLDDLRGDKEINAALLVVSRFHLCAMQYFLGAGRDYNGNFAQFIKDADNGNPLGLKMDQATLYEFELTRL